MNRPCEYPRSPIWWFARLDRHLLLWHPRLWAARPHEAVLLLALVLPLFYLSADISRTPSGTVPPEFFWLTAAISPIGVAQWLVLQTRMLKRGPFHGPHGGGITLLLHLLGLSAYVSPFLILAWMQGTAGALLHPADVAEPRLLHFYVVWLVFVTLAGGVTLLHTLPPRLLTGVCVTLGSAIAAGFAFAPFIGLPLLAFIAPTTVTIAAGGLVAGLFAAVFRENSLGRELGACGVLCTPLAAALCTTSALLHEDLVILTAHPLADLDRLLSASDTPASVAASVLAFAVVPIATAVSLSLFRIHGYRAVVRPPPR